MTRAIRTPTLKTRRLLAGLTITALAQQACCSDLTIVQLENGGNCDPEVYARIMTVLGPSVAVTSSSVANPSVITTATPSPSRPIPA
jgi:DNA-binding XRE family transcriptional regulator